MHPKITQHVILLLGTTIFLAQISDSTVASTSVESEIQAIAPSDIQPLPLKTNEIDSQLESTQSPTYLNNSLADTRLLSQATAQSPMDLSALKEAIRQWLSQDRDPVEAEQNETGDEDADSMAAEDEDSGNLRITVTGTRTPRPIQDSPATITVTDAEDINRLLMRDIEDLVRYEPGVSVQNNLQFGFQGFNIRGIDGNRVLIQVDGIRLPPAFQSGDPVTVGQGFNLGRDYFDLEILQTAEIIRGPASALYGSDALGGVVTYLTLEPSQILDAADRNSVSTLSTNFDSENDGFTSTLLQANRFGAFEYALAYTRRDSTEPENLGDNRASDRNNIFGRFVYNLNESNALGLTLEVFDDNSDTTTSDENLILISGTTTRFTEEIRTDRTRLSLDYQYDNESSTSFLNFARARVYFQDSETIEENERELLSFNSATRQSFPVLRESENSFTDRVFGGDVQLRSDFNWGNTFHRVSYGFDISSTFNDRPRDRIQTNLITGAETRSSIPDNFPTKDFPDSDTFRVGVYVQDEITFGNGQWSLVPGLRFDYYDLSVDSDEDFERNGATAAEFNDSALSPNIALIFQPSEEISLYGRYSRGFRAPLFNEVNSGFTNQIFGYRTLPNPDLEAETSNSFELGVRGLFPQLNFSLAGFYNRYDDFIDFQLVGTEPIEGRNFQVFQNVNLDEAETYGVEARAEYQFTPGSQGFSLIGALSWTVGNNLTNDDPLSTVNPFEAVVGLRYRALEDRWGVELISTFVGEARGEGFDPEPDQNPFVPDGFTVVDLIGYYRFTPNVTLNLGLFNLFDTEFTRYTDVRFLDRNDPLFDRKRDRFEQPGFNVRAGLTWRF